MFEEMQDIATELPAPLNQLQSEDYENLLNVVDQLRSEGISRYVDLPQLIVCGDQSCGKSSVLEAISGLDFPRKDNVCTRFATELILRRHPTPAIRVSIYPDEDRSEQEKIRLQEFAFSAPSSDKFGLIIKTAEDVMCVGTGYQPFSKDVLRVEITGPTQPHLTLVDLPGLYHASDKTQNVDGIVLVETLVRSYMQNPRSVMLAVISAKNDIALQKITTFTREVDPDGLRTLGIITKPDTLSKSSDLEHSFHQLAQNKIMEFRLGWHVLKNRSFEERECSWDDRRTSEEQFLSQGVWATLPRSHVGIHALAPRLSTILENHIISQMPSLVSDAQLAFKGAMLQLQKLGDSRQTVPEQRQYLLRGSEKFSKLANSSLNGVYLDPFFGDALDDNEYEKRLRAVVQNRLSSFAETMMNEGQHTKIVDEDIDHDQRQRYVYRTDFVEEVRKRMRRNRGRELPGNYNSLIISELFYQQTRPWEGIVLRYLEYLLNDVRSTTVLILEEVLDRHTVKGLLDSVIDNEFIKLEASLRQKTSELLEPQKSGHPITYNSQYIESVQVLRDQNLRASIVKKLKAFFGDSYPKTPHSNSFIEFRMQDLIESISYQTDTDMERFAASEAIDCMQAYYLVAIRKFVDDFSNLAIEQCLLSQFEQLFSPYMVGMMPDAVVQQIAHENEVVATERKELLNKLEVLRACLKDLQGLEKYRTTAPRTMPQMDEMATKGSKTTLSNDETSQTESSTDRISSPMSPAVRDEVSYDRQPAAPDEWSELILSEVPKKKKKHRNASLWE